MASTSKPESVKVGVKELPGEDFTRVGADAIPSDFPSAGSTAIDSSLPPVQRAAKLTERVRRMADERPGAAWSKLREEFEVQKLIWQSLGLVNGKQWVERKASVAQALVQDAITAGTAGAVAQALLKADGEMLSNTMRESMNDVVRQERATAKRQDLAERLAHAGIAASLPREAADKAEAVELVVACQLADPNLERLVRQTLLLPIPAELSKKTSKLRADGAPLNVRMSDPLGAAVTVSKVSTASGASWGRSSVHSAPAGPIIKQPSEGERSKKRGNTKGKVAQPMSPHTLSVRSMNL